MYFPKRYIGGVGTSVDLKQCSGEAHLQQNSISENKLDLSCASCFAQETSTTMAKTAPKAMTCFSIDSTLTHDFFTIFLYSLSQ